MKTSNRHRKKGARKWLTEAELALKYGSAVVAAKITFFASEATRSAKIRSESTKIVPVIQNLVHLFPCLDWMQKQNNNSMKLSSDFGINIVIT